MRDQLSLIVGERSEQHARILLTARENSSIAEITGTLRGPYCEFAKTLTADFALKPSNAGSVEVLVIEPCYWTPQLPFWYDLRLKLRMQDGSEREELLPAGIKRFYCEGRNFRLESKRIVLRGLRLHSPTKNDLQQARECETALVVENPTAEVCHAASRLGVPLVVDLRNSTGPFDETISMLEWYPAVMLVLVSVEQSPASSLRRNFVAVCVNAKEQQPNVECAAFAVELTSGERPPSWLATCGKPVIAIRKDATSEISTARAGCDSLQAELTPEFDLAGYFV